MWIVTLYVAGILLGAHGSFPDRESCEVYAAQIAQPLNRSAWADYIAVKCEEPEAPEETTHEGGNA